MFDHEIKSPLCCKTKFVEGTSQESAMFVGEGVRFNCGSGVVCEIQIWPKPVLVKLVPLDTATSLLPSAEQKTPYQVERGILFEIQVNPVFVEVYNGPYKTPLLTSPATMIFDPSAEIAILKPAYPIVLLVIHVFPAFVETRIVPAGPPAPEMIPRTSPVAEDATENGGLTYKLVIQFTPESVE